MRLFVAINMNDDLKDTLMNIQDDMEDSGVRGRFTKEENMHLTLAFIGEYTDPDHAKAIIDGISFEPFEITLNRTGSFGKLWWVGIEKCEPLTNLVKTLRHRLADAGIPFDRKIFSPHITVIRNANYAGEGMPPIDMEDVGPTSMEVDRISLMRSDFGKHGVAYTEL